MSKRTLEQSTTAGSTSRTSAEAPAPLAIRRCSTTEGKGALHIVEDEGALIRALDPRSVRPSPWANRHHTSFSTPDFEALRSSIAAVGTNLQPIKVRPVSPEAVNIEHAAVSPPVEFEIVFGHRRHRACLDLRIAVAAVVQTMSDQELFAQMDRENRTHKPLSPFEQGSMFNRALDMQLYVSAGALAIALGVDASMVSKALSIARLPPAVIQAFASPLDIQYRWAGPLSQAHRKDPGGLVARAEFLQGDQARLSSVRIFQRLVATNPARAEPLVRVSGMSGRGSIEVDRRGRLAVYIDSPFAADLPRRMEVALQQLLSSPPH